MLDTLERPESLTCLPICLRFSIACISLANSSAAVVRSTHESAALPAALRRVKPHSPRTLSASLTLVRVSETLEKCL